MTTHGGGSRRWEGQDACAPGWHRRKALCWSPSAVREACPVLASTSLVLRTPHLGDFFHIPFMGILQQPFSLPINLMGRKGLFQQNDGSVISSVVTGRRPDSWQKGAKGCTQSTIVCHSLAEGGGVYWSISQVTILCKIRMTVTLFTSSCECAKEMCQGKILEIHTLTHTHASTNTKRNTHHNKSDTWSLL